ncbi:dihydrodipicolinate synthase family protein [Enterococcus faecalis]|uniref:dihydrodipicolinate synthase family protein n=1 Tax=Enterococcus faecalis TaxID=1351 RepID=UPI001F003FA8|nr:dihydrodipicolinate synthase family protein [Enterococcus faecalis]
MKLAGIITAMVTPLDDKGNICKERTAGLVNKLINEGVSGLFILGTNGEFFSFTDDEKVEYSKWVVELADGRVPVYAGSGGIPTNQVIELSNRLAEVGVSAVSIITPFLISLTDDELLNHYQTIAKNVNLPIILYNIPANTKINLSKEVVAELAKLDKIIGIKDSSGDLENLQGYLDVAKNEAFSVLVGSDSKILPALKMGGTGAVAATSNVLTKTDVGIYQNYQDNNLEKAEELQKSIDTFRMANKLGSVPSMLKYALSIIGYEVGAARLPVMPVNDHEKLAQMQEALKSYQEIENFGGYYAKN